MKPEQLEAIRKRSDKASGNWLADYLKMKNAQVVLGDDVPALLAEVERLRKALEKISYVYEDTGEFAYNQRGMYVIAKTTLEVTPNASEEIR